MQISILNNKGEKISSHNLNPEVFGIKIHKQSVYDCIIAHNNNLRQGTHKVKDRSEVRGGGRKPWKQKGTGRARHGSIRSPIWRGGGIVFGPTTQRNYKRRINKKIYKLALKSILTSKINENSFIVIDKFIFNEISTKSAITFLTNLKLINNKVLIITDLNNNNDKNENNLIKSVNNIQNINCVDINKVSVYDLIKAPKILLTKDMLEKLEGKCK